ncbi:MAG: hypothetical protein KGI33_05050 [Thaumarchaeota archaeon]|nr:hypothetical protein [Nitrososphaerota archaeon]
MLTNENRRIVPYSFRIDGEVYSLLEEEARQKEISMNTLLNQIGKEHLFRNKFKKIGCVLTPKDVLREIFDGIDSETLTEIANKLGSKHAIEYIQMFNQDGTETNPVEFLEMWFKRFPESQHKVHGSIHYFSARHDINEKYSSFEREFVRSFAEAILHEPVRIESSARTIAFSFAINS